MKINSIPNPNLPATPVNTNATTKSITMKTQQSPSKMPDLRPGFNSLRQQQAADLAASKAAAKNPEPAYLKNARAFGNVPPPPTPISAANNATTGQIEASNNASTVEGQAKEAAPSQALNPSQVALARKEQALRKAQQELKAQREAFESEKAKYVPKERLTSQTLEALAEAGISYDKLVELQLSQTPPTESQQLKAEIDALKQELASVRGEFSTRDKQSYDQAVNVIRKDAELLVESNPAYETIKALGETKSVVEYVQKWFDETGEILSVEEAAKDVEDTLVERKKAEFDRLLKLSKFAPAKQEAPAVTQSTEQAPQASTSPAPTLTNRSGINRPLTTVERAILAYKGELK